MKKEINNKMGLKAYNDGTGIIEPVNENLVIHKSLMPVELHLKEDGAIGNKPSLAFLSTDRDGLCVVSEVSVEMLANAFKDIGYNLSKIEDND